MKSLYPGNYRRDGVMMMMREWRGVERAKGSSSAEAEVEAEVDLFICNISQCVYIVLPFSF